MRWPVFDRIDFLVTKVLIVVLAVAVPVTALGVPLVRWPAGRRFTWELEGQDPTSAPVDADPGAGTTLRGTDVIAVSIDDPGAKVWVLSLLPALALSIAAVVIAWQLLRLLRRIQDREPFVLASAVALRVVALTLAAGAGLVSLLDGIADSAVAERALSGPGPSVGFDLPVGAFLGALLLLALSDAFAQGVRLHDDVEGLV